MLVQTIRFSIRHPTVVLVLALMVLAYGIYSTRIANLRADGAGLQWTAL